MPNQVVVASKSFGKAQPQGAEMLRKAGLQLTYLPGEKSVRAELCELMAMPETVAVVAGAEPIDAGMITASPNLKVIAMHGVGLNHIDQQAAAERGVAVKAVPGGNAEAVADLAWGLMLAVARKIIVADQAVRTSNWGEKCMGLSLNDKTLGIVGFGAIGQAVARRACGFRIRVLVYDAFPNLAAAQSLGAEFVSVQQIYKQADYISLHVPLLPSTENMIAEKELKQMRPSVILINTSRGGVIDEQALCAALAQGWIGGAGLDVFQTEPMPSGHPLLSAPNCVLTPHIGARTHETVREIGLRTAENILSVIEL